MIKIKGTDWAILLLLSKEVKPDLKIRKDVGLSKGQFSKIMNSLRNSWLIETETINGKHHSKLTKIGKYYANFYKRVKSWDNKNV